MRLRNKHERDPAWERKHLEERIRYLEQQIGAHTRLDGWTLEGHKEELKEIKKELKDIDTKIDLE